jgi:hypothetical protein
MVVYTHDHPKYIEVLSVRAKELPRGGPQRKSIKALINYASKHAPGLKDVYAELSEVTHVGSIALWASHRVEGKDEAFLHTSWSSAPRWRNDEQALVACAQTLELAEAMVTYLHNFAGRYLLPLATNRPDPSGRPDAT